MHIEYGFRQNGKGMGTAVAVGTFDGVHLGHLAVVRRLLEEAAEKKLDPVVVTFDRHPMGLVHPSSEPLLLNTLDEKVELLRGAGAPSLIITPFTAELAALTAKEFVEILVDRVGCKSLVMGHDNTIGKGGEGTAQVISTFADALGFALTVVAPVEVGGILVSSSEIRRRLAAGEVHVVRSLLGRAFTLGGPVVEGYKRGRDLGFATANLDIPSGKVIPRDGVYATMAEIEGRKYPSVSNVGFKPTFDGKVRNIEVHVLDNELDLYGRAINVEFIEYIRPEMVFSAPEALKKQVAKDIRKTRDILSVCFQSANELYT